VSYASITTDLQLRQFCQQLAQSKSIALDTEFVSEHTYRPVLCLLQVVSDGRPTLIDAIEIEDMTPFWQTLAQGDHETIVHAGRGDLEFCLRAVGRLPKAVMDVQIGAGLVGVEYPAGYSALIRKLLDEKPKRPEGRTDWRRRPLSGRQIEYALDDVLYLPQLRDEIHDRLVQLGRLDWLHEEMESWQEELRRASTRERWRRVSGSSGLSSRSLAVLRELWRWREGEAKRRDCPVRHVLRDDLIVELAKRQTADVGQIRMIRGLQRRDLRRHLGEMAGSIQRALDLPQEECPQTIRGKRMPQLSVLGQFLFSALGIICRQARLAPALVGNPSDIRDLISHRTAKGDQPRQRLPVLARGWRAEVVGRLFEDLLAGKKSIRIIDPASEHPLAFEPANRANEDR